MQLIIAHAADKPALVHWVSLPSADLHFDNLGTVNAKVIRWRFTIRIKTINDVFYFLFINNHLLASVRYASMWRAWRDERYRKGGCGLS